MAFDLASQDPTIRETREIDKNRNCWVCFAADEDDRTAAWVKPCKCKGTTKWVHQTCLQRWVDEKQKGNSEIKVSCPQCGMFYKITFPHIDILMHCFDKMDEVVQNFSPFFAVCVLVGSCYWVAVTYGAITIMQVVGYHSGMAVMENADPLVLLVGLPTIPIFLILGKMIPWEDKVVHFIRKSVSASPFLQEILPIFRCETTQEEPATDATATFSDPGNATRLLTGALTLPTIARFVGKTFFPSVSSTFMQTMLGGASFLLVKGLLKVYFMQKRSIMKKTRLIVDNPEHIDI